MIRLSLAGVNRIVGLGAHADDIEIGVGGTIGVLCRQHPDAEVTFVIAAGDDVRRREAEASARELVGDRVVVHVGAFQDTMLPYADPRGVKDWVRSVAPPTADLVFAPRRADRHQDHRFMADMADQVFRHAMVLRYEVVNNDRSLGSPDVFVELSEEDADRKVAHLLRHFASQHDKDWYDAEVFRGILRIRGLQAGAPSGLAEGFGSDGVLIRGRG
jgi:LmbE family N-acetylglucosaminyl deacetylase